MYLKFQLKFRKSSEQLFFRSILTIYETSNLFWTDSVIFKIWSMTTFCTTNQGKLLCIYVYINCTRCSFLTIKLYFRHRKFTFFSCSEKFGEPHRTLKNVETLFGTMQKIWPNMVKGSIWTKSLLYFVPHNHFVFFDHPPQ